MRVVLVDNFVMPKPGSLAPLDVHPHLGLLALAAVAEAAGHTVRIYDPKRALKWGQLAYDATIYESAASKLLSMRPEVVGFTTLGCSFVFALNVAAVLKRREPDLPVLLGGPHATMLHREILERFEQVDIVVRYEADRTFPDVLDGLEGRRFDSIPGISWRAANGLRATDGKPKVEDLDTLPLASYDHYPIAECDLQLLRIEAGRGCPFNCTFCSTAGFFQRSFRLKSARRLVAELDLLHARYGFSDFKLDHDMFTVNRRKVIEFCEAVSGRGYRWRASARVDCVDRELLARMAEAGCSALYFGIETGSARMQRVTQKRLDLDLVQPILAAAGGLGIETTASFITGYPEETQRDQDDTLDMLGRCFRPSCLPQLHILAPEPGTPLFQRLGDTIDYDGYGGPYNVELVGPEDERLILRHPDIFQTYYFYPAEMPRSHYVFAVEAVDLLRRAGPVAVNYLLRAYGGRLSNLVRELRLFADGRDRHRRPDAVMLEAYLGARFGPEHHMVSLFRFALGAGAEGEDSAAPDAGTVAEFDPAESYRLSPDVRIMRGLHDCQRLLEKIRREPETTRLLDESEAGERGVYLLKASGDAVTSFQVDPGVEAILGLFDRPRNCRQVADWIRGVTSGPELETGFFEDVVRSGIIVAAATAAEPDRVGEAISVDAAET